MTHTPKFREQRGEKQEQKKRFSGSEWHYCKIRQQALTFALGMSETKGEGVP